MKLPPRREPTQRSPKEALTLFAMRKKKTFAKIKIQIHRSTLLTFDVGRLKWVKDLQGQRRGVRTPRRGGEVVSAPARRRARPPPLNNDNCVTLHFKIAGRTRNIGSSFSEPPIRFYDAKR
ncbi:hypothetical protein EVAR_45846_1 [Eumeta japonica]|uniref:Uncharacterized protein n=1 Tax=Eumeta variegata TaxID=151549 RepID=A0A4C1WPG7_EUMVA|nr:hypothetical protein EVAR_45846_1 [Eumeta japonica]